MPETSRYSAADLEEKAGVLTQRLLQLDQGKELKQAVQLELTKPEYTLAHLVGNGRSATNGSPLLTSLMEKMGVVRCLKRAAIDLHGEAIQIADISSTAQAQPKDEAPLTPEMQLSNGCCLDAVRHARDTWDTDTREELMRLSRETGKPLLMPAAQGAEAAVVAHADDRERSADANDMDPSARAKRMVSTRFLYDGNDLLHALQVIQPSNRSVDFKNASSNAWGSIRVQLHCPPSVEFRRIFSELSPGCGQIGLDDGFPAERSLFLAEKNRIGDLVLPHQSVSMARQYAKTGCPLYLRPHIWRQILGLNNMHDASQSFQQLQSQATSWVYLTDDMYLLDLQQTLDSSDYFVFQDHLESVIMAFTRDVHVEKHARRVNGTVRTDISGLSQQPAPENDCIPPNGVLPFSGLVMYVAPLSYLYTNTADIYFVFREMYERYWSKLNAIGTDKSTILPLCQLFEALIIQSTPAAMFHLLNIGIKPIDIAFPWIQCAFSGILEIPQVLLLWDRVLSYDSLELIAIFAAALFHYRVEELVNVTNMDDINDLFAELIEIQVVPMLQEYIFLLL